MLLLPLVSWFYDFYKNEVIENKCNETETFYEWTCFLIEKQCEVANWNWVQSFTWWIYNECIVVSCNEGFEKIENQCLPVIRERIALYTWTIIAWKYSLDQYPKIKINEKIEWWNILLNVNFTDDFMGWNYDNFIYWWTADGWFANPAPFWFYFFLWRETVPSLSPWLAFWWFVNAISYNNWWDLRTTQELNWVVPWNAIVGWYMRDIPIKNNLIVATKKWEWREDYKFKNIPLLNFINNSMWSELFIWWFLSSVSWREWRTFTKIDSIEIRYIGSENAIEFY